ncbi:MAG: glycosyltransferase [Acidobacteriota bacterium]
MAASFIPVCQLTEPPFLFRIGTRNPDPGSRTPSPEPLPGGTLLAQPHTFETWRNWLKLDIIVPTRNRAAQLHRLLDSIREADCPADLEVTVFLVDNGSTDATKDTVLSAPPILGKKPVYVFEPQLGLAPAVNHGLRVATGDVIGRVDDDERIAQDWLTTVYHVFQDPSVGFISGPCKPDWGAPAPPWLPRNYPAVIGWIESGDKVIDYGPNYDGKMMGGNAVIRRDWFDRIGPFDAELGRKGERLTAGEDAEFHDRLIANGARGFYTPALVIYHYIPPERLTKRYHRRWCLFRGTSLAHIDRVRPQPVAYAFGVPRYMFGMAARSVLYMIRSGWRRDANPETVFTNELAVWDLMGFMYGKYFHAAPAPAAPAPAKGTPTSSL